MGMLKMSEQFNTTLRIKISESTRNMKKSPVEKDDDSMLMRPVSNAASIQKLLSTIESVHEEAPSHFEH